MPESARQRLCHQWRGGRNRFQDFIWITPTDPLRTFARLRQALLQPLRLARYQQERTKAGVVWVRIGTIESDIAERPMAHIFVGSKANWEETAASLPQFVGLMDAR